MERREAMMSQKLPRPDHFHQVACCQSLPAQPEACCHVWCDLPSTMIQKNLQNFPHFQLLPFFFSPHTPLPRHVSPFLALGILSSLYLNNKVSPKPNMSIYFVASCFRILPFILLLINGVFKGFCGSSWKISLVRYVGMKLRTKENAVITHP